MKRNLYYMAPRANVRSIATHGILALNVVRKCPEIASGSSSIADPFVNARRDRTILGGRSLHDYVPLYWATHTPMQYVRTVSPGGFPQEELVFFVMDADEVLGIPGVVTSDGNAASDDTAFYPGDGALPFIDWAIVATPNCYWKTYKRKKCAEVLVLERIPREYFRAVCCCNARALGVVRRDIASVGDPVAVRLANSANTQVAPALYY